MKCYEKSDSKAVKAETFFFNIDNNKKKLTLIIL